MKECLIIVESPTKEKVLKEMLGEGYQIASTKGHIKDLPKSRLGIDIKNDFKATWIVIPNKRQMVKKLKNIAIGKEKIFLATDPDREGEAISWHIANELKLDNLENRIIFNEITKDVVRNAVLHPRRISINLVNSQIARRLLDRLVGYKVSPLCYKYAHGKSAGRVQSVAVHLIVEREKEIQSFSPEEYWKISALLLKENDRGDHAFEALLISKNGKKLKINNQDEAENLSREIRSCPFSVSEVRLQKEYRHAPLPLKTSTLQQIAYNKLNFSVKKTMHIAQQLYEGISIAGRGTLGLITYMRTDSTRVSDEAKKNAKQYIEKVYGYEYISSSKSVKKESSRVLKIQDAHEAIRPTTIDLAPDLIKNELSLDQYKLYQLIWKYFISSQMKSALLERDNIKIQAGEFLFEISAVKIIFPGYLDVLTESDIEKKELPSLEAGEKLNLIKVDSKQSFTKPPARYNEASLVKVLEKEGIGRPSTYAIIIDKIQSRGYVEKVDKKLLPTQLGIQVDQFLTNFFSNIIDKKFTAKMENSLDKIESGEDSWQKLLEVFYHSLSKDINGLIHNPPDKLENKKRELTEEKCSVCGSPMEIKSGPYGKYLACSKNPLDHPTKPFLEKIGIPCPIEGCNGEIIKRKSKKGRTFYGCSRYPECNFYSVHLPVNKRCPKCGSILVKIHSKRKGTYYRCSSKNCDYIEKVIKDEQIDDSI